MQTHPLLLVLLGPRCEHFESRLGGWGHVFQNLCYLLEPKNLDLSSIRLKV
jgi:hypothetical protein